MDKKIITNLFKITIDTLDDNFSEGIKRDVLKILGDFDSREIVYSAHDFVNSFYTQINNLLVKPKHSEGGFAIELEESVFVFLYVDLKHGGSVKIVPATHGITGNIADRDQLKALTLALKKEPKTARSKDRISGGNAVHACVFTGWESGCSYIKRFLGDIYSISSLIYATTRSGAPLIPVKDMKREICSVNILVPFNLGKDNLAERIKAYKNWASIARRITGRSNEELKVRLYQDKEERENEHSIESKRRMEEDLNLVNSF